MNSRWIQHYHKLTNIARAKRKSKRNRARKAIHKAARKAAQERANERYERVIINDAYKSEPASFNPFAK